MTEDSSTNFVKASLSRADRALSSAKLLLKHRKPEDAVSRAYYSMFHATRAILFARSLRAKTHKGVITLFGEHIIRKGIPAEKGLRFSEPLISSDLLEA